MSKGHFTSISYHRRMLDDSLRMEAYQEVVEALVTPNSVVVDVGAGTGVLSLMAARAGARKVYAIESADVAHLIAPLAAANGLAERVCVLHRDAAEVASLPEPADLLITECMGTMGLSDDMFELLSGCCQRLLRPDAHVCPQRVRLHLAPARVEPMIGSLDWSEPVAGFDFNCARRSALNDIYVANLPQRCVVDDAQTLLTLTIGEPAAPLDHAVRWRAREPLDVDALLGWFTAELSDAVTLDTGPGHRTHWGQVIFPLGPCVVPAGGVLEARLRATPREGHGHPLYDWHATVRDASGATLHEVVHGQAQRFDPQHFRPAST